MSECPLLSAVLLNKDAQTLKSCLMAGSIIRLPEFHKICAFLKSNRDGKILHEI